VTLTRSPSRACLMDASQVAYLRNNGTAS
jgi:hypothetical protein